MADELANNGFGVPPWMQKMRDAAASAISADDVRAIIQKQVEKAKDGDERALTFIFDKVLGGGMKGATFIQNNYGNETPVNPSDAVPGSKDKVELMRKRVASGNGCFNGKDRAGVDLS